MTTIAKLAAQLKDLAFLFVPGDPLAAKIGPLPAGWVIFAAGAVVAKLVG